jgi:hypothetical protein
MGTRDKYEFSEFEQQIWDLMDEGLTTLQIIDRLGTPPAETATAIRQIVQHRGTPGLERIDRTIERMRAIRVY